MKCRKDITVRKIWVDDNNAHLKRPDSVEIILLRDGKVYKTAAVTSADNWVYTFRCLPIWNSSKQYEYKIDEPAAPAGYSKLINGFNVTNTLISGGFTFNKTSIVTGLSLQGAVFEIRQNGILIAASASDAGGRVSFSNLLPGEYRMSETVPPVGYMNNTDIYEVIVSAGGAVTIDGMPANQFSAKNTPKPDEIILRRATAVTPAYMAAPNAWPLHGTIQPDLYMLDRILITLTFTPALVKWAYGMQDETYFRTGGGTDITDAYQKGIPAPLNSEYTVYALFSDGTDAVARITIDRLRDGSAEMPYLLIDFTTADTLNPFISGINQFTLYYMQGNGVKLTQHYEIYENIDMEGKTWNPLGTVSESSYNVIEGFTGSLYGNGHEIANLVLGETGSNELFPALFQGVTGGAAIQNLGLINCNVNGRRPGGFVSTVNVYDGNSVLLKNLSFKGSITSSSYAGGIVCYGNSTNGSLIIDSCNSEAYINARECASAIIGHCNLSQTAQVSINSCYASGSITDTGSSGRLSGIIGLLNAAGGQIGITNCLNNMTLTGAVNIGGIIGIEYQSGTAVVSVSECCNLGDITGINIGGIIGSQSISSTIGLKINNCYNGGTLRMTGTAGTQYNAGIMGSLTPYSVVLNSYNTGNIISTTAATATMHTGGITGRYGTVENCTSAGGLVSSPGTSTARISPHTTSTGNLNNNVAFDNMQVLIDGAEKALLDMGSSGTDGISVSAVVIKTQTLYENTLGWDFANVWSFGNGAYKLPILRGIPSDLQPVALPPHLE